MKTKTKQTIEVFKQVIDVMEQNHKLWNNVPKLNHAYDKFLENYKKLTDAVMISGEDINPIKIKIEEKVELLRKKCNPFIGVLQLWAKDKNKKKTARKLLAYEKQLNKVYANGLLKISRFIMSLVEVATRKEATGKSSIQNSDKKILLSDYGISDKIINDFKRNSENVEQALLELKKKKAEITEAEKQAKRLTTENRRLLKNRISKIMRLFIHHQPEFFEAFNMARKIKDKDKISNVKGENINNLQNHPEEDKPAAANRLKEK